MPIDVTLGGQNLTLDNPNAVLGLLGTILQSRARQQTGNKEEQERQRLQESLAGFQIPGVEDTTPKSFEEVANRYRGARSRGEGQDPELLFSQPSPKPQVTNLRQLVDIIQGIKGLPSEFAGQLVSRLTGIPDQSQQQAEGLLKLRLAAQAQERGEALEEKRAGRKSMEESRQEQLGLQKEKVEGQKFQRLANLSAALERAPLNAPDLRKKLSELYLRELMTLEGEGETPSLPGIKVKFTRVK